jgi:hypothetical protein
MSKNDQTWPKNGHNWPKIGQQWPKMAKNGKKWEVTPQALQAPEA